MSSEFVISAKIRIVHDLMHNWVVQWCELEFSGMKYCGCCQLSWFWREKVVFWWRLEQKAFQSSGIRMGMMGFWFQLRRELLIRLLVNLASGYAGSVGCQIGFATYKPLEFDFCIIFFDKLWFDIVSLSYASCYYKIVLDDLGKCCFLVLILF